MDVYDTTVEGRLEFKSSTSTTRWTCRFRRTRSEARTAVAGSFDVIQGYAIDNFGLGTEGEIWTVTFRDEFEMIETEAGLFVVLPFDVVETFDVVPDTVDVRYEAFVGDNDNHNGFFHIGNYWEGGVFANESNFLLIFDGGSTTKTFDLDNPNFWTGLAASSNSGSTTSVSAQITSCSLWRCCCRRCSCSPIRGSPRRAFEQACGECSRSPPALPWPTRSR